MALLHHPYILFSAYHEPLSSSCKCFLNLPSFGLKVNIARGRSMDANKRAVGDQNIFNTRTLDAFSSLVVYVFVRQDLDM